MVMGGDSCSKGHEFESQDWMDGHFSHLFVLRTLQFLQQIYLKNVHSVSDSNTRPSGHECPPITTRPGLLARQKKVLQSD